jgi:hypothetical protein
MYSDLHVTAKKIRSGQEKAFLHFKQELEAKYRSTLLEKVRNSQSVTRDVEWGFTVTTCWAVPSTRSTCSPFMLRFCSSSESSDPEDSASYRSSRNHYGTFEK